MRCIVIIMGILFWQSLTAQIPLGEWEGNFKPFFMMIRPQKIMLELYRQPGSSITGATHLSYSGGYFEHYKVSGFYDSTKHLYIISEDSLLDVKVMPDAKETAGTYMLQLDCNDSVCMLTGKWKTHAKVFLTHVNVGVWFRQQINKPVITASAVTTAAVLTHDDSVLKRQSDIQSLIEIHKDDSVKVDLYDNGEIDGDSVSLYLDNMPLVTKQMISINPITINLPVSQLRSISRLKLVAESLGSIPPCTALMIVQVNEQSYRVSLSSNFEKNAVVEFVIKE